MLFCTREFLVFFLVVFSIYWALPWKQARVFLLLAASFWFYATWSPWLAGIVVASSTFDYCLALGMQADRLAWRRRLLLVLSITANLGLLCYFKYANFFLHSLQETLHRLALPPIFQCSR